MMNAKKAENQGKYYISTEIGQFEIKGHQGSSCVLYGSSGVMGGPLVCNLAKWRFIGGHRRSSGVCRGVASLEIWKFGTFPLY